MLILMLRLLYVIMITPLIFYAIGTAYLILIYVCRRDTRPPAPIVATADLPRVTVQLPLYNERYVARRLIQAVAALDYPADRLQIQVLDDSTDDTPDQICGLIGELQAQGVRIDMIHRTDRSGYKAGALANGLKSADGEFIAIFDADFVPAPNFLRKIVPYFLAGDRIGVVQGRWGHLNAYDNLLTRSQALMIDGHFAIEQFARSSGELIFTFNGTCGLWRRTCIDDAGGWHMDTLTEDSDLSFRAQMRGWRFVFVPDVIVPGEVPPQMIAFKQQQARWAKGTTQVFLKLGWRLLRSNLDWRKKIMGFLQLLPYPTQPLTIGILILMPVMMLTQALRDVPLGPLGLLSAGVPLLYILSQQALYRDWAAHSLILPVLMIFSTGMTVNNSRAALSAYLGQPSEFKRTPKFHLEDATKGQPDPRSGSKWQDSQYAHLTDKNTFWEIGFGLYALGSALLALQISPSLIVYFMLYAIGFLSVAAWTIADRRRTA